MRVRVMASVVLVLGVAIGDMGLAQPSEFATGVVDANGLTFHYLEAGEGPTVLALHGFPDHARSYRHQLTALAKAGYRVVAPYMRGYAPTEIPDDGYFGIRTLAQDAVALADALSDEPIVLMGRSAHRSGPSPRAILEADHHVRARRRRVLAESEDESRTAATVMVHVLLSASDGRRRRSLE